MASLRECIGDNDENERKQTSSTVASHCTAAAVGAGVLLIVVVAAVGAAVVGVVVGRTVVATVADLLTVERRTNGVGK